MAHGVLPKPLGLVLMVSAHMVVTGRGHERVTGALGGNITLCFTFNVSIAKDSNFGVYITDRERKIWDTSTCKSCIRPGTSSVFFRMTNLTLNDSHVYYASLLLKHSVVRSNNTVQLVVQPLTTSTAAPQTSADSSTTPDVGRSGSFPVLAVLVLLPVLLLAAVLLVWISCLKKRKEKEQQGHQQTPNPTSQEAPEPCSRLSPPSVIYSVLNFPKRPPAAAVEVDPRATEYDVVSYPPRQRAA